MSAESIERRRKLGLFFASLIRSTRPDGFKVTCNSQMGFAYTQQQQQQQLFARVGDSDQ